MKDAMQCLENTAPDLAWWEIPETVEERLRRAVGVVAGC